jgi:hypothetical protein
MNEELEVFKDVDITNFLEAGPVEAVLQLRRRCMERLGDIRLQTVLADQYRAEAGRLRLRAKEVEGDEVLRKMHLSKAVVLETQAIGALDRVEQSKLELKFYLQFQERSG